MNEWMAGWVNGYVCLGNFSEFGGKEKTPRDLKTLRKVLLQRSGKEEGRENSFWGLKVVTLSFGHLSE